MSSRALFNSVDVLVCKHFSFFFPGICIKTIHYLQCSFGKRPNLQHAQKQNKLGVYTPSAFLANVNLADSKSHPPAWDTHTNMVGKDKAPNRGLAKWPLDFWHPAHTHSIRCCYLGRLLLMISWNFMNPQNLNSQLEGWKRTSLGGQTPFEQKKSSLVRNEDPRPADAHFRGSGSACVCVCVSLSFSKGFPQQATTWATPNHKLHTLQAGQLGLGQKFYHHKTQEMFHFPQWEILCA